MFKALYIERGDGDWDLIAVFSTERDEGEVYLNALIEKGKAQGEAFRVEVGESIGEFPDVWSENTDEN